MTLGQDEADRLAYALVQTDYDFDAVEKGPLRAEWTEEDTAVAVTNRETGEAVAYSADDLAIAASDTEVNNARQPTS